jgi:hypothetical protein
MVEDGSVIVRVVKNWGFPSRGGAEIKVLIDALF